MKAGITINAEASITCASAGAASFGAIAAIGAEPEPLGSQTYIALEWFLAWRGLGLPIETPSVRQ